MSRVNRALVSVAVGFLIEVALFASCWFTAGDFRHEGPDTSASILLSHVMLGPEYLLQLLGIHPYSGLSYLLFVLPFVLGLPICLYAVFVYWLLRPHVADHGLKT
jgi:hypothetical protein